MTVHGGGTHAGQAVIVPVADHISAADRVLPGAPEAVVSQSPVVIANVLDINFRPAVPVKVQGAVNDFFASRTYVSLASLAVFSDPVRVHGVLNVESSIRNLIDQEDRIVQRLLSSIEPFAALLSAVDSRL